MRLVRTENFACDMHVACEVSTRARNVEREQYCKQPFIGWAQLPEMDVSIIRWVLY